MVRTSAIRVLAGLVVGAVMLGGCGAPTDKSGGDPTSPLVLHGINSRANGELQQFFDQVATLSNGSMSFELEDNWHGASVNAEAEAITAVQSGAAEVAVVPARAWHGAGVNSFDALIAPMAVDSYAVQEAVLQDAVVDDMLAGVEPLGLTGIGVAPGPMRKAAGITRHLLVPSDFQGASIAINPGEVPDRSLRALGAIPLAVPFEHVDLSEYDGTEQQVAAVEGNEYDGIVTSVSSNVNLWPRPMVIVGNSAFIRSLSDEQLTILRTAAKQAVSDANQAQLKEELFTGQALCNRARLVTLSATTDQLQELRDAFQPANDWLSQDPQTSKFMDRIRQIREQITAAPESAPSCPTTSSDDPTASGPDQSTAGQTSPIDGTYELTTTQEEGAEFGLPVDQNITANTGTFAWSFADGKFVESQFNGSTQTWASGTYTVDGDRLTMNYLDGDGAGPGGDAHMRGGDSLTWYWSLYRDQLTLRWEDPSLPPSQYPSAYAVKPWTRTGDAPAVLVPQTAATTPN